MSKEKSPHIAPGTLPKKSRDMVTSTVGVHKDIYKKCLALQKKKGLPYIQDIFRIAIAEYIGRNELQ